MQAVLKAQINKTDRNDARGIAQMMRVGMYRPVHVKTLRSQKLAAFSAATTHGLGPGRRARHLNGPSNRIRRCQRNKVAVERFR